MKRLCFLGNSHVASIKLGLPGAEIDTTTHTITLFGSHAKTLKDCQIREGCLMSDDPQVVDNFRWTSGGCEYLKLDEFDTVVVVAGASVYAPDVFWSPTAPDHLFEIPLHSEPVVQEVLAQVRQNWGVSLARGIAAAGLCDVIHIGSAFVSDAAPFSRCVTDSLVNATPDIQQRLDGYISRLRAHAASLETANLRFLPPPANVLQDHGLYTRHEFSRGSRKLTRDMNVAHDDTDYIHMNGDYGAAVLRMLVAS